MSELGLLVGPVGAKPGSHSHSVLNAGFFTEEGGGRGLLTVVSSFVVVQRLPWKAPSEASRLFSLGAAISYCVR